MSALRKVTSPVVLSLSLALAGAGCAAQTADEDPVDEQASAEKAVDVRAEPVGQASQACGGGFGGFGGGWGGCGGGFWPGFPGGICSPFYGGGFPGTPPIGFGGCGWGGGW